MFVNSNINLAAFRTELNTPSPERDLSTFIDQMQRVSLQVSTQFEGGSKLMNSWDTGDEFD